MGNLKCKLDIKTLFNIHHIWALHNAFSFLIFKVVGVKFLTLDTVENTPCKCSLRLHKKERILNLKNLKEVEFKHLHVVQGQFLICVNLYLHHSDICIMRIVFIFLSIFFFIKSVCKTYNCGANVFLRDKKC